MVPLKILVIWQVQQKIFLIDVIMNYWITTQGLPVFYYIMGWSRWRRNGKSHRQILLLGLKWRQVLKPIVLKGNWNNNFKNIVAEASLNFAIGIEEGIY